jgi:hypothetical protein
MKTYQGLRKPHRFKRKKSILGNRFFWLGILLLIFIGAIFYFLFLSETFQIEKIIVTGEEKVSTEEIKQFIEEKLGGKILFFPTKSTFSVNLDEIRKNILNNFPQIAEVEIKRGLPDALNVLVVERLGLVIWCQQESCFLLDNEGVIFEEALPEIDLIKIINQQSIMPPFLGDKVIEKDSLSKIFNVASELETNLKIPIKEFIIAFEDKLIVLTEEGWEIYFNLQGDVEWQLTKLGAVLEEKIPSEKRKDLEYIELRFGNFANPKYRD